MRNRAPLFRLALACVALCAATLGEQAGGGPAASPTTKRYALRFKRGAGAVEDLGWRQLPTRYVQQEGAPLVIEAEASTRVALAASDISVVEDVDASGGLAIAHVGELENRICITTPGQYQVWYRAYFPRRGSWNHLEQMDDRAPVWNLDSDHGEDKKWLWAKGPAYELSEGEHLYRFPSPTAWRGGTMLDKIVLAPKGAPAPTGMGPDAALTTRAVPEATTLISNRLVLKAMISWRLEIETQPNGGRIEVERSHDRGKTWLPLTVGKSHPVTDDAVRVTFRVRLVRSDRAASPRFRNMALIGVLNPDFAPPRQE